MSASDMPPDFLTRLAGRALGLADPVEPRLPSLFEGLAAGAVFPAADPASPETADRARPGQDRDWQPAAAQQAPDVGRPGADADEPLSAGAAVRPDGAAAVAAHDSGQTGEGNALRALPPATGLPSPRSGRPSDDPARVPEVSTPARGAPADSAVTQVNTGSAATAALRPGGMSALQPAASSRRREGHGGTEDAVLRPRAASSVQGALVPRKLASPAPAALAVPGRPGTPPRPAQEAVVHVSIGRVEVRASQAVPTRQAAQAASPKPLSLDDYLKQQERQR